MTNNLKCPFCGAELENEMALFGGFESDTGRLLCSNQKCSWRQQTLEPEIWQALIDGKKAQDALMKYSLALSVAEEFIGSLPDYPNYSPQPVLDEIESILKGEKE